LGREDIAKQFLSARKMSRDERRVWFRLQPQLILAAVIGGHENVLEIILEHCFGKRWANVDYDVTVQFSLLSLNLPAVDILLRRRLPFHKPGEPVAKLAGSALRREMEFWSTMIRIAAVVGCDRLLAKLLDAGSRYITDQTVTLALDEASRCSHVHVVRYLVERYSTKMSYSSALFWAARKGNQQIVDVMLDDLEETNLDVFADALAGAISGR
jgi:hypothetical protein